MKKLTGFESILVIQGLGVMRESMRNEIIEIEAKGKNAIMTVGYVDMIIDEAIKKIKILTLKQK